MIRVIKYGKRRIQCKECYRTLEFEEEDIKSYQTGMNEYESFIQCPVCKNNIVIPYNMSI